MISESATGTLTIRIKAGPGFANNLAFVLGQAAAHVGVGGPAEECLQRVAEALNNADWEEDR